MPDEGLAKRFAGTCVVTRILLAMVLCLAASVAVADDRSAVYAGRPVVEVIDEFRTAGHAFAYSTNLVTSDLLVSVEPDAADPPGIVRQILAPHGLTIRSSAGVHVVVRDAPDGEPRGNILLVVKTRGSDSPVADATVSANPGLGPASRLRPGIYEYRGVLPGRYRIDIGASGFAAVTRVIDVRAGETTVVSVGMDAARPEIETIAVSASRYEILSDIAASRFLLDQRTIQSMPDIGEDPIRVTHRLPGAAASGASAKTHFRGGEQGEIGIMLNGQWLFDPFHIRDYQSIFSAIDSRAIEGVEVYTGGFPVRFGDRMSGLVLMESLESVKPRHTEVGLSVFASSVLAAGNQTDRRWLVSARRGNLDLVIDPEFGRPSYYDAFAQFEYDVTPDATLSINALFAEDSVRVVLETLPEELEQVTSRTRNVQVWMQLENRWSAALSSRTLLSAVAFTNARDGSLNDVQKLLGRVADHREVDNFGLRQDWSFNASEKHHVQWGLNMTFAEARYAYRATAEYFGLQALYEGQEKTVSRALTAVPEGGSYALYFSDRWRLTPQTVLEWGLRWDDQTYTDVPSDSQLSPRVSVMRMLGPRTELRAGWGRYHQSQGIGDLQVEDGVANFWPAQRADHFIIGLRHLFRDKYAFRIELFQKDMRRVRPRFENLYDPLGLIPELQADRVRLEPRSARSRGLEISVDRSSGPLTWWTAYTLSEVTDRIDGREEPRSWDQRHALQAGIGWKHGPWELGVAASAHSGWPTTDLALVPAGVDASGNPSFVAVPGARNALRHGTFAGLDFRASRRFALRKGSLMVFVEISNVSNRKNECCRDWDIEEGGNGEPSLELSHDYWMPLLPAVGVLWEF